MSYLRRKKDSSSFSRYPIPVEEIIKDLEAILITHTHIDHWDDYTAKLIPKHIPIFVQDAADKKLVVNQGFIDVRVLGINTPFME